MARDFRIEAQKIVNEYLKAKNEKNANLIKSQNSLLNQYKKQQGKIYDKPNNFKVSDNGIERVEEKNKVNKAVNQNKQVSKTEKDLLSINSILNVSLLSTLIMVAILVYQIIG